MVAKGATGQQQQIKHPLTFQCRGMMRHAKIYYALLKTERWKSGFWIMLEIGIIWSSLPVMCDPDSDNIDAERSYSACVHKGFQVK